MNLDSHQHFWHYDPKQHAWIDDDMATIRRDWLPADLQPILQENGFDGCVAVQADQTEEETKFLLDLATKYDFIKGVVGWIDLRAENLEERLDHFAGNEKLKGWRHIVQGEADPLFMLRDNFLRGIEAIGKRGYTYDVLIFPHQLVSAYELIKQFPEQKFVIDHLAKPYARASYIDGWAAGIRAVAELPNVMCKVSGLITEADYKHWTLEGLKPYVDTVVKAFGPDRIMFGSDWPVCLVAGKYDEVVTVASSGLENFSTQQQQQFWGGNCVAFYNLAERR